jgi:hypothetical protein
MCFNFHCLGFLGFLLGFSSLRLHSTGFPSINPHGIRSAQVSGCSHTHTHEMQEEYPVARFQYIPKCPSSLQHLLAKGGITWIARSINTNSANFMCKLNKTIVDFRPHFDSFEYK